MCESRIAVAGVRESATGGVRVVVAVAACGSFGVAAFGAGLATCCLAFAVFATCELTAPATVDAPNAMSRGRMTRTESRTSGRTTGAAGFIRSPFVAGTETPSSERSATAVRILSWEEGRFKDRPGQRLVPTWGTLP